MDVKEKRKPSFLDMPTYLSSFLAKGCKAKFFDMVLLSLNQSR